MRSFFAGLCALTAAACGGPDPSGERRAAEAEPAATEAPTPPARGRGLAAETAASAEPPTITRDPATEDPATEDRATEDRATRGPLAPDPATPTPWTTALTLTNTAHPAPPGAPNAVVHAPPTFDAEGPLHLVVFLHGWSGCVRQLVEQGDVPCRDGDRARPGWALGRRFDEGGADALFVIPQLAFLERDGSPGRFAEPGRFRAFLAELLDRLGGRVGGARVDQLGSVTLLAHSAGFEAALAVLGRGDVDVRNVVLFDALYRGVEPFTAWAAGDPDRRLVSLYTGGGRTARQSRRLAFHARQRLGAEAVAQDAEPSAAALLADHRVVVARATVAHGDVPAAYLPALVAALLGAPTGP